MGAAIARALAGRGMRVAITYRSSSREAEALVRELQSGGAVAEAFPCDQRDPGAVRGAVAAVQSALGPVDLLVNNAAVFRRTPWDECSVDEWDELMQTNLRGPWLFCQETAGAMRARGNGLIVNLTDIAAGRPYPSYLAYCASKSGLNSLTRGLAVALAPEVRVNAIAPGTVEWPEDYPEPAREAYLLRTPLRRIGGPEDVAGAVLFFADNDYLTGVVLPVDGGRSAVL